MCLYGQLRDTPMHRAAEYGHAKVIELLHSAGANTHHRDGRGKMPIHYAAENNCANAVLVLMRLGAHSSEREVEGMSPLDLATMKRHVEVVRLLNAVTNLGQGPRRVQKQSHSVD